MYFDKKLFENFASISFLKVSNFILGWLLYPYVIRIVGIGNFGSVIFAQSIMLYFVVFTDYGFSLSAPREIARLHKTNPHECGQRASNFLCTQILLGIISFLLLVILIQTIPFFFKNKQLLYLSFVIVPGQILFPVWFFQGIEKMKYLAWFNLLAKLILIVGIMLFVHDKADYLLINLFWGLGNIIAGLGAWAVAVVRFQFRFQLPGFKNIFHTLHQDFHLFIASITNIITFNSTIIIMGLFTTKETLGLYSIADRIFMIIRQIVVVAHQSVYPRIVLLAGSATKLRKFFKDFIRIAFIILVPASFALLFLAPLVTYIFSGKYLSNTSTFIQILSFTPLIAVLNLPACQSLLVLKKEHTYTTLSLLGAVFHLLLSLILIFYFGGYGAAWGLLATELFLWLIFNRAFFLLKRQR